MFLQFLSALARMKLKAVTTLRQILLVSICSPFPSCISHRWLILCTSKWIEKPGCKNTLLPIRGWKTNLWIWLTASSKLFCSWSVLPASASQSYWNILYRWLGTDRLSVLHPHWYFRPLKGLVEGPRWFSSLSKSSAVPFSRWHFAGSYFGYNRARADRVLWPSFSWQGSTCMSDVDKNAGFCDQAIEPLV